MPIPEFKSPLGLPLLQGCLRQCTDCIAPCLSRQPSKICEAPRLSNTLPEHSYRAERWWQAATVVELPGVQGRVQGGQPFMTVLEVFRPLVAPVCDSICCLWTSLNQPLDSALPDVCMLIQHPYNHSLCASNSLWATRCLRSGTEGTSAFELRVQGLEQGEQPGSNKIVAYAGV
jgi:hypothetical protein